MERVSPDILYVYNVVNNYCDIVYLCFAIFVCVMLDMMVLARRVGAEMQLQRVTAGCTVKSKCIDCRYLVLGSVPLL